MSLNLVAKDEYESLLLFEKTRPMQDALIESQSLKNSVIYVHYVRRNAVEPFIAALEDCDDSRTDFLRCLANSKSIFCGAEEWSLMYLGIAAALDSPLEKRKKPRMPADRFKHEFGLGGNFKQAPALEALYLVLRSTTGWTTRRKNPKKERGIVFEHDADRQEFMSWCAQNVRCAWQEFHDFPRTRKECRILLTRDEEYLIKRWKPLLNVQRNQLDNALCGWLKEERRRFRCMHMASESGVVHRSKV